MMKNPVVSAALAVTLSLAACNPAGVVTNIGTAALANPSAVVTALCAVAQTIGATYGQIQADAGNTGAAAKIVQLRKVGDDACAGAIAVAGAVMQASGVTVAVTATPGVK
jgi:hypothetical protein